MRRRIGVSWPGRIPPLGPLPQPPKTLQLTIPSRFGEAPEWCISQGDLLTRGQTIATSQHLHHHAPLAGRVQALSDITATLTVTPDDTMPAPPPKSAPDNESYADLLCRIGLVGMGGSMFPAARKVAASDRCHTLVINGVECEPGITIDQSLLLHASDTIRAGVDLAAAKSGAKRIVLAIGRNKALARQLRKLYPYEQLAMPRAYPAGAERLIMHRLTRKPPAIGELPFHRGYLVQNVASLWAVGRALETGMGVIERPLSLAAPTAGIFHNLMAPVGTPFSHILDAAQLPFHPETDILIAGGLMMGRHATPETCVDLGTTSLVIIKRTQPQPPPRDCIRCGACNTACPLGLHPIGIIDRQQRTTTPTTALRAQIDSCFLCGACEAVCPSDIPLIKYLKETKSWVRNHPIN